MRRRRRRRKTKTKKKKAAAEGVSSFLVQRRQLRRVRGGQEAVKFVWWFVA